MGIFCVVHIITRDHSLDDAAGQLQEGGVGDADDQAFVGMGRGVIDLFDLDRVIADLAGDAAAQDGRAFPDILAVGDRKRFSADRFHKAVVDRAEDPLVGVGLYGAQQCAGPIVDHAGHDAGTSDRAFFHAHDLGVIETAVAGLHHFPGVRIADPMAQGAETAV